MSDQNEHADLDADLKASLASIFRRDDPAEISKVAPSPFRRYGRRRDFDVLVQAFRAHGFRPSCAWYLNDEANIAYARKAPNGGRLCCSSTAISIRSVASPAIAKATPMRAACADLTVMSMP